MINFLVGMCKSQRDIEVEQQRQWRASKKERDSIKAIHNAMNIETARSPRSPTPPPVEIPLVEERVRGYMASGYYEQYVHFFYPDVGASTSGAPSHPPPYDPSFGVAAHMPPPPPASFGATFGDVPGTSYAPPPPPYGMPSSSSFPPPQPHRLSAADQLARNVASSLFGLTPSPHGTSSKAIPSLSVSLGIAPTSLEATTLSENIHEISNLWLGGTQPWDSPLDGSNGDN